MKIWRVLISSKIRIKLLIAFILVVIIPLITVGFYSIHSTSNALEKIALSSASEKIFLKAKKIEKFLNDARFDICFLSQSPTLLSLIDALESKDDSKIAFWRKRLAQEFLAFSQNKRIYYQIGLIDKKGQEIVRVDSYGTLPWIASKDQLRNRKGEPNFVEAFGLSADQVFVSDMSLGGEDMQTSGLLMIEYAVPVLDRQFNKRGVVFTSISAENLLDIVKEEKNVTGGETFLIDKTGRYLSYPERIKQWGETAAHETNSNIKADYPTEIASQLLSGSPGTITEASDAIISYTPIFPKISAKEDFWVLVNVEPKRALFSSVVAYRKIFAVVVFVALLAAFGLSIGLARHLSAPLVKLRDGANLIAQGNLKHRLDIRTGDEIQQLADEFNKMAEALNKSYSNLEAKVQEKTAQLQKAYDQLQSQQQELKSAYEQLKTTHQQLQESEEKYSDIVENAYDMINTLDAEGNITSANKRQLETLGYREDEIIGLNIENIIAPNYLQVTREAIRKVMTEGSISDFETALITKTGKVIPVEVNASAILKDGKYVGLRSITRDITRRKELEAQLLQSEKLSSIGRLAAGVAHEINNPIGVISMFIQMLLEEKRKRGELEDSEFNKLKVIESQAEQISEITKNLLEFSRQSEPHLRPVNINDAIEETLAVVEPQVSRQKIKVSRSFQSPLPQVMADNGQLKQVFMNVILNACDAMPEGGELTVTTATRRKKASNGELRDFVEIRFADTGCGISQEHLSKVFEPFFSTKGPGEGTGLGLAVSYGIVKNHKGSFEVESKEGVGTTFIISFPISIC
ncbi:hypothetical protein DRQ12_08325 [candidate division KSB1 bacterium]|nr:MAG: hypothetical protein DRQ12_08325 [candidate division KSB1 bacterium]HDI51109.1 PAS domain S-box protein [Bacteroidota bacterium]